MDKRWKYFLCEILKVHTFEYGLVAQLVRAPPCHGGGRGFEPHPGRCIHQLNTI